MTLQFMGSFLIPTTLAIFLGFCAGIQDVVAPFSASFACQSVRWRTILAYTVFTTLLAFAYLNFDKISPGLLTSWMRLLRIDQLEGGDDLLVLYPALVSASIGSFLAVLLNYPLALGPLILLSQMASLLVLKGELTHLRLIAVVYLGLPFLSGSVTWIINRIFLQAFIFSDPENRFRRTLAWASIFYSISIALVAAALLPRLLLFTGGFGYLQIVSISLGGAVVFGVLSFFVFKYLLRAIVKRQAFLRYPQEYALYLDRSDRAERSDLEARGLGPSSVPAANPSTHPSATLPAPNLLHAKRSEEIFRPLLVLLGVATYLSASFIEIVNLYYLMEHLHKRFYNVAMDRGISMIGFVALLIGRVTLSKRVCRFAATGLITELRPSQAFAIQFGILLTIVVSLYSRVALLSSPIFFWISSLSAVGVTSAPPASSASSSATKADPPQSSNKSLITTSKTLYPTVEPEETFRIKEYGRLLLFWILMAFMAFLSGLLVIVFK